MNSEYNFAISRLMANASQYFQNYSDQSRNREAVPAFTHLYHERYTHENWRKQNFQQPQQIYQRKTFNHREKPQAPEFPPTQNYQQTPQQNHKPSWRNNQTSYARIAKPTDGYEEALDDQYD